MTHSAISPASPESRFLDSTWILWKPADKISAATWAETRRRLSAVASAIPGPFSLRLTEYLREPLEMVSRMTPESRKVREVCGMKSAQIGWTDGFINNVVGWSIDVAPCPAIIMFPRDKTARDYSTEKFDPMVEATECLQDKVASGNKARNSTTQDRKTFPGGFIKLVGANSTGGVKSTPAKLLVVEEPDDCNRNLKGQGDSIGLLRERGKSFSDALMLIGGTPTLKGFSAIEAEMQLSDQRRWFVACHECGASNPLEWERVKWVDGEREHPVYGHALPETARYSCAACDALWTNQEKNRNVARGKWVATATFDGVVGYYFNELMSPFPQSDITQLVRKFLAAQKELENGNAGPMTTFWNATLGLPWEWQSGAPSEAELSDRAEAYPLFSVPSEGLILTAGVDVQHDRLAVVVRAWGPGEESWLVWWGELYGRPGDKSDGVWTELDSVVTFRYFDHASAASLPMRAISIDSSDGGTADAVYDYVRRCRRKIREGQCHRVSIMPIKGSSVEAKEIYTRPGGNSLDATARTSSSAARRGLRSYPVGTVKAKDLIIGTTRESGRLRLRGNGPGRMHWPKDVRSDYWEQVLSEVKAPDPRSIKRTLIWQKKAGTHNESLDCEVYALHAARSIGLQAWSKARWDQERELYLVTRQREVAENSAAIPQVSSQIQQKSARIVARPGRI